MSRIARLGSGAWRLAFVGDIVTYSYLYKESIL